MQANKGIVVDVQALRASTRRHQYGNLICPALYENKGWTDTSHKCTLQYAKILSSDVSKGLRNDYEYTQITKPGCFLEPRQSYE